MATLLRVFFRVRVRVLTILLFRVRVGSGSSKIRPDPTLTVAHMLVVESANKLAKVLEHVLRSKKYKKSFWKFSREGRQLETTLSTVKLFALTAVTRKLFVECANKLAEVLEHVLGVKKY